VEFDFRPSNSYSDATQNKPVSVPTWKESLAAVPASAPSQPQNDSLPPDMTLAPCSYPFGCATHNQGWIGASINTRTGNYHYSQQDISITALGGPLRSA
jgi:hypothetical protein